MTNIIRRSGLQPIRVQPGTHPPSRIDQREIRLGFPGFDPLKPSLDILIFDDSWSLNSPGGNDPVARRYEEAAHAVDSVQSWAFTGRQKVAVMHFDHPAGFTGPQRLDRDRGVRQILGSLRTPEGASGTSELLPSLHEATRLARAHDSHDIRLTVFSDWLLLDPDLRKVFQLLEQYPGAVHAVVLNAHPPLDLEMAGNITVTRVSSDDPPGMLAAALAHSLTATRRGHRHPVLRTRPARSSS